MAKITKRMKKDGSCSYCIRVSNGYDRAGRQVLVNRTYTPPPGMTGKKLERELKWQADAFEQEVRNGISLEASMKMDDLIERWFTEYAEKKLKPKTVYNYRRLVPRISAGLGQLKVCQVKPSHLMAFYSNLEEQGVREDSTYTATPALLERLPHGKRGEIAKAAGIGEDTMRNVHRGANVSQSTAEKVSRVAGLPLSKAFTEHTREGGRLNGNTVQHYHRMLSSVFTKAVQWGLVPENPCKRAEAPKAEEIDVQALEELDVAKLLNALQDAPTQFSVITQLALFTGARRGEICGLRWSDVDLDAGTISIERTLQYIPGKGTMFTSPKTKRSRRCIKIGPDCVQLLQEYRKHQKAERFKIGSEWMRKVEIEGKTVENDLLFTKWNGAPIDPKTVTTWFPGFLTAHNSRLALAAPQHSHGPHSDARSQRTPPGRSCADQQHHTPQQRRQENAQRHPRTHAAHTHTAQIRHPAAHAGSCAAPAAPHDQAHRQQPRTEHTPEPFYQPSNMEAPRRSIDEMQQGKTVTKTLEELTALEDD